MSCSFLSRPLRWMQTMTFAIGEVNRRSDLLPHLKLGFHIRDSSDDILVALRELLVLVNGQPESMSGDNATDKLGLNTSSALVCFLQQVSYFASCSCLSNKKDFGSFMRTMPSDAFQVRALARLLTHFGWSWLGVIGVETDYARLSNTFSRSRPKLVFAPPMLIYTPKYDQSNWNFHMQLILQEIRLRNLTDLQWIAGEAWSTGTSLWKNNADLLKGTLGFAIQRANVIPGLKQHLLNLSVSTVHKSALLTEFWEETFNCWLNNSVNGRPDGVKYQDRPPCTGTESLEDVNSSYTDVSQLRVSYNVYKAVYLVAHALQDMSQCEDGKGPFINRTCSDPKNFQTWQVRKKLQVKYVFKPRVSFGENGDPVAYYDLMNWHRNPDGSLNLVKVGYYDASLPDERISEWLTFASQAVRSVCSDSCPAGFRVARKKGLPICCYDCVPCAEGEVSNSTDSLECNRCPVFMWSNKARDHCVPKTIEFLSFHEVMGAVLCGVSVLGACISMSFLIIFFRNKNTPIVRANNMELSFLLLLFLAVCFLISLLFIGEPSDWLCRIRYPAFGISFALCISCLLAKTAVVLMAFRATLPGSNVMKWFGPNQQRASVVVGTSIQVEQPLVSKYYFSGIVFETCVAGSEVGFWCVLGYIGVLACACLLMAFLARKLPDNFNEAKFITFSMLIFFAVWITFIPVYVSTPGKFTVAVHIFAILASAFGLLFCIFAPKCYVIILRPDRNSKKHMMAR
uniref:Olfactory receptor C family, x1 n=1 Tax=Cynoglossus semilaevis TaxID=244447 RepID=A0A3P8VW49_CYNSE